MFESQSVSARVSYISAVVRHRLPGDALKTALARICRPSTSCGFGAVRLSSIVTTVPRLPISLPRLMLVNTDAWIRSLPPARVTFTPTSSARLSQVVLAPRWKRRSCR